MGGDRRVRGRCRRRRPARARPLRPRRPAVVARRRHGRILDRRGGRGVGASPVEAVGAAAWWRLRAVPLAAGRSVVLALAGLAALGAGRGLAASPRRSSWRGGVAAREPRPSPGPSSARSCSRRSSSFATIGAHPADGRAVHGARRRRRRARDRHRADRHGPGRADRRRAAAREPPQARTDDLTGLGNRRHLVDRLHAAVDSCADGGRRAGAAARRPRRLQGAQRHARPPRRRRGAAPDRPAPEGAAARGRHARPARRRRVRGRPDAGRRGDGERRRAAPALGAGAVVRGRRHPRPHRRQRRHRDLPRTTPATPSGCSSAPTSRCTRPSACAPATRSTCPGATATAAERLALVGDLHGALEAGELVLHYQPKADVADRRGARRRGAGALGAPGARPARPRALPPARRAERADPRADGVRPRPRAGGDGRAARAGHDLSVAVNLGPADLLDLGLPSEVERMLRHARLRAGQPASSRSRRTSSWPTSSARSTCSSACARSACAPRSTTSAPGRRPRPPQQLHVDVLKIDRSFVDAARPGRARRRDRRSRSSTSRAGSASASWPRASTARGLHAARRVGLRRDPGPLPRRPMPAPSSRPGCDRSP